MTLSLRSKLTLGFALVAIIPLVILQQVASGLVKKEFAARTEDQFAVMRRLIEGYFGREAKALGAGVRRVAVNYDLIAAVDRYDTSQRSAQFELTRLVEGLAGENRLPLLTVYDSEGRVIASAHEPTRFDMVDRLTIARALAHPGEAIFDQEEGIEVRGLVLRVNVPVDETRDRYWVSGGVRIDREFLQSLPVVESLALVMVDRQTVLTAPTAAGDEVQALFAGQTPLSEPAGPALEAAGWSVGHIAVPGIGSAESVEVIIASSRLPLQSFLDWLQRSTLLLLAGCVLLSWVMSYAMSRRWTAPVDELIARLERIAGGDLESRLGLTRQDELGRVAAAIDSMTSQLAESRSRLLEAERVAAWQEIARRLAHEIKNPLSPISLSMDTLRRSYAAGRPDFPRFLDECTTTVLEEVDRLRRIVEEFSAFGRLPPPRLVEEDFHEVIRGVVGLYASLAEYRFTCTFDSEQARFRFDPDQMNRLLVNLVKNAIEAIPGGGEIRIETRLDPANDRFQLWIRDSGPGIPADQIAQLFRPCESRKPGGSGLGLAIVYRIAREHGGSVGLTEAGEIGARFLIELPLNEVGRVEAHRWAADG